MAEQFRRVCWLSLFGLVAIQSALAESEVAATQEPAAVSLTVKRSGAWILVESPSFRCWSQLPESDARLLAESCETWRNRLRTTWISEPAPEAWVPKCEVLVHPDRTAYNQALRRPGDVSVGSTIMNFDQGRTVQRRIDVRADASDWSNAALPHELTHVVLGERFGGHALPRWADEGIAMLSESADKSQERLENLRSVLAQGPTLSMVDLTQMNRLPQPQFRDAFYSQSVGLTSFLVRKSTPAKFADFVADSVVEGMDNALLQHYSLNGVGTLQREWNEWVRQPAAMSFVSLPIQVGKASTVAVAP
ncbi:MAG: hypothetical protein JSS49_15480 [Planctomycetes bacterium]|nr:hypothetical protein [Planctomycetota bacterium]